MTLLEVVLLIAIAIAAVAFIRMYKKTKRDKMELLALNDEYIKLLDDTQGGYLDLSREHNDLLKKYIVTLTDYKEDLLNLQAIKPGERS